MIATRSGGYEGIGFALPINMVVRVYNDIIRDGHVTRGSIGVTWQQNTKPETLKAMGFDHGVIISDVHKGGPADKAGVKPDDIILAINGKPLKDGDDLMGRVADMPVGTSLHPHRGSRRQEDGLQARRSGPHEGLLGRPARGRRSEEHRRPPTKTEARKVSKLVQFGIQVRALGGRGESPHAR